MIAGLIAAGIALYKNWDKVKEKLSELWSNVKEKFNAIKETITGAFSKAKEAVTNKVNEIKDSVANSAVGQAATKTFSAVKNTVTKFMGAAVDTAKEKLGNMKTAYEENGGGIKGVVAAGWEGIKGYYTAGFTFVDNLSGGKLTEIKSSFSTKLNGALSTVGSVMESIRAKFSEKMESAKTAVSNAIDRIKGFFNFEWSLPHLKMPHFSISGSFSLNPPSVPSFGVEWYKTGGIMTSPTVFGMNGTRLMVGGEAGAEAILPLAEFYTELNSMLDRKLKAINQNVNAFIEVHNYIDGDEVASRTTEKVSDNLAIATKKRR